jgi:hypothetical protein
MEGHDRDPDAATEAAAKYIMDDSDRDGRALIPDIRCRFGLTTLQAIEACRIAQKLRTQGGAYAKAS